MSYFRNFFAAHPLLPFAFSAAIGAEAALHQFPWLLLILMPLNLFCFETFSKRLGSGSCGILAFILSASSIHLPDIAEEGITGTAKISIEQLSFKSGAHQSCWLYKGRILSFTHESLKGVPYLLVLPGKKKNRPLANTHYEIACTLRKGHGNLILLKPLPNALWQPLDSFSLAELRFELKQHVKNWIEQHFSTPSTIQFLSGLVIGEFDDRQLRQDFSRFGLLHLLAISGFHFSILASLLTLLLRPFLSTRGLTFALILILSLYFIFLGWGPSILRAWITLLVFLGSYFHERFSSSVNSLGAALFFAAFIDPLMLENLGFQFSFLTTAAILMGLEPFSALLDKLSPKRELTHVLKWPKVDQLIYLLLGFMKNGLSLSFATTCVALPISLYYFETFPLLSLFYNIFFPFLVSVSMTLLLLGALLFFIPPLAQIVHTLNDYFTSFILNMTYDIPHTWDFAIKSPKFSPIWVVVYIIIIFIISIYIKKYRKELKYLNIEN